MLQTYHSRYDRSTGGCSVEQTGHRTINTTAPSRTGNVCGPVTIACGSTVDGVKRHVPVEITSQTEELAGLRTETKRLRAENARLLRLLKLTPQQATPPGPAQTGFFDARPGPVHRDSPPTEKIDFSPHCLQREPTSTRRGGKTPAPATPGGCRRYVAGGGKASGTRSGIICRKVSAGISVSAVRTWPRFRAYPAGWARWGRKLRSWRRSLTTKAREQTAAPRMPWQGTGYCTTRAVTPGRSPNRAWASVVRRVRPVARAVAAMMRSWAPRGVPSRRVWANSSAWCSATVVV